MIMDKKIINVGIIGFGVVGAGAVEVLQKNSDLIMRRLGGMIRVKKVADLDIETERSISLEPGVLTPDVDDILNDPEISIVVELIGGIEPAKSFILRAMKNGKHVVTANKALLALHGAELFDAAKRSGKDLMFEASVGGAIPIIRSIKEGLAANRITGLVGILNGTANFIMTSMTKDSKPFNRVLKEAQGLGIAESDPTLDIEGWDAAHKIAILASLAFGTPVPFEDVYVEGIKNISPVDIEYASNFGYCIKLLAIAGYDGKKVEIRVHPAMIPYDSMLANVNGSFNALSIHNNAADEIFLYGRGAGSLPTGSAVAGDIIELARQIMLNIETRVPSHGFQHDSVIPLSVKPMEQVYSKYYFRINADDKPGVLSSISGLLGMAGISIESVLQKGRNDKAGVPIVIFTHEAMEKDVRSAILEIERLKVVNGHVRLIRIMED